MKRSGEIQRKPESYNSAKYESRSASDKQEQKKKQNPDALEQS